MLEVTTGLTVLVAAVLIIVLVLASRQPRRFMASRSLRIAASRERLHALINDLHRMSTWNPYTLRDPDIALRYSGPDSGPGATYEFSGPKSGAGSLSIIESQPERIAMRLLMSKPFAADNRVEFTLASDSDATIVTWAMKGDETWLSRIMAVFIDVRRMVERDFEEGLANLRSIAEARESEVA